MPPYTLARYYCYVLFGLSAISTSAAASTPDGFAVGYGVDESGLSVDAVQAAAFWDWDVQWLRYKDWQLDGYWEFAVSRGDDDSDKRTNAGIWDVSATPVFRWRQSRQATLSPCLEAGMGAHLLSHTSLNGERKFGAAFQFGSHVGVGICFGPKHAYDLTYRFRHLSNAGIRSPNNGINFSEIRFGYWS